MGLDRALYNFARRGVMPSMQGRVGSGPISFDSEGKMIKTGVGREFFVAGNWGSDTNEGDSWDTPFLTLAAAITANNADVAADKYGWATRNRIYISADTTTETLVAFPNKCDVIGVGSYDANDMPGITGNHAPVNTGNYGTRFINIWFKGVAAAAPIVTLASSSSGIQFLACVFSATSTNTHAIKTTASPFLKIRGNRFEGAVATATISILAGEAGGTEITDNLIGESAAVGILINASTTCSWNSYIRDNVIQAATITIDDNSDLFYIINNELISLGAGATVGTMADAMQCDINVFRASGNRLACSNVCGIVVPPVDSTT